MITIINYGMGNPQSMASMLKYIGFESKVTSDAGEITAAGKLILPGVGAFDAGMDQLGRLGLVEVLNKKILEEKTPILGICLGMQLFTRESEEGKRKGFCWLGAKTKKFDFNASENKKLKIPHMGWNTIDLQKESRLFSGLEEGARFYFVHSYHLVCDDRRDVAAMTNHGYDFVSAVEHDNILGVQFHPEKSHKFGMRLLRNFAELY
ncbi:MAG: imidazole glycerol phosphate synthase subunit HisH [Minisyncoccales bacterium]